MQPLCGTNPIIVLKFSMLVLESCPSQTIDLFLSGNIPTDMVSSYLKKHSPNMQARYLELMLAMNENAVFRNLHNEMVRTSCILFLGIKELINSTTFSFGWGGGWSRDFMKITLKKIGKALF